MTAPKNAMEIFQVLDKSNCRECGHKTCLAFAGAVFRGEKDIRQCPRLDQNTIEKFSSKADTINSIERNRQEYMSELKNEITTLDFTEAAERTGGSFSGEKLTIKILGKDFSVDKKGNLSAEIHVNPWVASPFLHYVLYGKGVTPSGNWVSFRELKEGKERYPLFQKRGEEALKRVADLYTGLFDDMVHIFGGKQVEKQFESDISVVLYPLPKVPVMICYWKPDDGLESSLNLFFDETADQNLDIGTIFSLGAGITQMFVKIAERHGIADLATS
jgi:hypothetical protein